MTDKKIQWKNGKELLDYLNATYLKIHTTFEDYFWVSMMGDHSVDQKREIASKARDDFRANESLKEAVDEAIKNSKGEIKERLQYWERFFSVNQVPAEAKPIKRKISALEAKIEKRRATRKQGYVDPKTKKFIKTAINNVRSLSLTHDDEAVRKACFNAMCEMALGNVDDYVKLVQLRNEYARALGFEDFYAFKLMKEEGMTKKELFGLLDTIYDKTKYAFKNVAALEKTLPGLRKPWNYSYMLAGSFAKEEDPYFPMEEIVEWWGRSFAALGINYQGSSLVFDLLERNGKYNNGFCHWPEIIHFENGKRIPGRAQLTCNVTLGIPGQSAQGIHTLFHECGHAAHLLNVEMKDVCVNTEYPPTSTAWDETQSMFLDTVFAGIEWRTRYAKNKKGEAYPFEIFERKVKKLSPISPLSMMGLIRVCSFEKEVYGAKNLTAEKVISAAKKTSRKYLNFSVDSLSVLEVPHIYAWDNACSYHAYGLAELAVFQWREYFFKKYGYIVDNPNIGKEMKKVWSYGSAKTFPELVKLATGKKLGAEAYIRSITKSVPQTLKTAKERIATLAKKPRFTKTIDLKANISIVDGKKVIATNKQSFADMVQKYAAWLERRGRAPK